MALIAISILLSAFSFLEEGGKTGLGIFIILFGIATFFIRWLAKAINYTLLNTVYYTIDHEKLTKHYRFRNIKETCYFTNITGYSGGHNTQNKKQKISLYINDGRVINVKKDSIEGFNNFKSYFIGGQFNYLGWN